MSLYTEEFFRNRVSGFTASAAETSLRTASKSAAGEFDIFLSHSVRDARVILGVRDWRRETATLRLMSKGNKSGREN